MKAFFGSFFGALFAILFLMGVVVLLVIGLVGIAGSSQKGPDIPKQALLILDLTVPIMDAPKEFNPAQLFSELTDDKDQGRVSLRDVLRAIKGAAADDRIKGIYITGSLPLGNPYASSYPALKEIREALTKFKESKKPVFAYVQLPLSSTYYLDSVADKVFVDPQAEFILRGPASAPVYYSGFFKKYGIGVQVFRVGKYKSFVEPYIRENMSPENREQLVKLFGDIWTDVKASIERSRNLPDGSLDGLINQNGLIDGDLAVKSKLGDELVAQSEIIDRFKKDYGVDSKNNTFNQVTIGNYLDGIESLQASKPDAGSKIAVIYAEGEIVDGEGAPGNVGGDRYARQIRKFRDDSTVKAIVLRVNSPGGSALASEIIYRELKAVSATKPVIVSMGGYAASGGYYIASAASKIFAEPTTVTGSIGVFGLEFNLEKIASDNGLTTDSVTTTTPLATLFNPLKAKSDADLAILQKMVDKFYQQFLNRVSAGRNLTVEQVNELAQGRVWSGSEADKIMLIDEIGGLRSAIEYAGKTVQLGDQPRVIEYPAKKDLNAKLQELFKAVPRPPVAKADAVDAVLNQVKLQLKEIRSLNDPEGIYARFPADVQWN
jgi:protease IV